MNETFVHGLSCQNVQCDKAASDTTNSFKLQHKIIHTACFDKSTPTGQGGILIPLHCTSSLPTHLSLTFTAQKLYYFDGQRIFDSTNSTDCLIKLFSPSNSVK